MVLTDTRVPFESQGQVEAYLNQLDVSVMKLGTERVARVLAELNTPQDRVRSIHVVGTNGKGSVSAMLSSVYTHAGYRVGLFTSPHLQDVKERIRLNALPVSEALFVQAAQVCQEAMLVALPEPQDWLTYFEFLTVMAFWLFQEQQVDIAVIEAGLGGRLDSTNVLAAPDAVIVTSVSFDHMERLGQTLGQIASEKAAVMKPGGLVFSPLQSHDAAVVIEAQARRIEARLQWVQPNQVELGPLVFKEGRFLRQVKYLPTGEEFYLSLLGRYQAMNLAVVLSVLEALASVLPWSASQRDAGLAHVTWPARFQYDPEKRLIIDGSHNAAGIETLLETLSADFSGISVHWGISLLKNRDPGLLAPLLAYPATSRVTVLADVDVHRYHSPENLSKALEPRLPSGVNLDLQSIAQFLEEPCPRGKLKVVTGSLYTGGACYDAMGTYQSFT